MHLFSTATRPALISTLKNQSKKIFVGEITKRIQRCHQFYPSCHASYNNKIVPTSLPEFNPKFPDLLKPYTPVLSQKQNLSHSEDNTFDFGDKNFDKPKNRAPLGGGPSNRSKGPRGVRVVARNFSQSVQPASSKNPEKEAPSTDSEHAKLIEEATEHFKNLLEELVDRADKISLVNRSIDFTKVALLNIGWTGGDGIGPKIMFHALRVLKLVLAKEIEEGKVALHFIKGLSIQSRIEASKALTNDALATIKECHFILKPGLTTVKDLESANVAMRRDLNLDTCIRKAKVNGNHLIFFTQNTEGTFMLGNKGVDIGQVSIDFSVATEKASEIICRKAFEYAKKNTIPRVTVVTKANLVKKTDGLFVAVFKRIAKEYTKYGIQADEMFIDNATAELHNPKRQSGDRVYVLPAHHGDVMTDVAAELGGGIGTAASVHIGETQVMFDTVGGDGSKMVQEGRGRFANPSAMINAVVELLVYMGKVEEARRVTMALELAQDDIVMTGNSDGGTTEQFTDRVIGWLHRKDLEFCWNEL